MRGSCVVRDWPFLYSSTIRSGGTCHHRLEYQATGSGGGNRRTCILGDRQRGNTYSQPFEDCRDSCQIPRAGKRTWYTNFESLECVNATDTVNLYCTCLTKAFSLDLMNQHSEAHAAQLVHTPISSCSTCSPPTYEWCTSWGTCLKSGLPPSYNIETPPPPPPLQLPVHSVSCNGTSTCANRVFVQVGFSYHHATATITCLYNHHCRKYTTSTMHHIPPPLATTTTQCKLHEFKWSMCANGWKEN